MWMCLPKGKEAINTTTTTTFLHFPLPWQLYFLTVHYHLLISVLTVFVRLLFLFTFEGEKWLPFALITFSLQLSNWLVTLHYFCFADNIGR